MSSLLIRNLPEALHRQLREQAQRHHRSLNKEILYRLERSFVGETAEPLPPALRLRSGRALDIAAIEAAIAEGRE